MAAGLFAGENQVMCYVCLSGSAQPLLLLQLWEERDEARENVYVCVFALRARRKDELISAVVAVAAATASAMPASSPSLSC